MVIEKPGLSPTPDKPRMLLTAAKYKVAKNTTVKKRDCSINMH